MKSKCKKLKTAEKYLKNCLAHEYWVQIWVWITKEIMTSALWNSLFKCEKNIFKNYRKLIFWCQWQAPLSLPPRCQWRCGVFFVAKVYWHCPLTSFRENMCTVNCKNSVSNTESNLVSWFRELAQFLMKNHFVSGNWNHFRKWWDRKISFAKNCTNIDITWLFNPHLLYDTHSLNGLFS